MSTTTEESSRGPANRHAPTAVERQRLQLEKLLKDPTKAPYVPPPPKDKAIRPPREMMKNVQGSSAGAGSGEFHVYKAGRRREYERLKLLDEAAQVEAIQSEFERRRREAEEVADAKTAKNRAKRQKKKERAKGKRTASEHDGSGSTTVTGSIAETPLKKRRLVNGKEIIFRKTGLASEDEGSDCGHGSDSDHELPSHPNSLEQSQILQPSRVVIHEED